MDSSLPSPNDSSSHGKLLLAYGLGCFLISLCLNFHLGQQAQVMESQFHQRTDELNAKMEQGRMLEQSKAALQSLTQDAVNFSVGHPDVREVLNKHIKFLGPAPAPPQK